MKLKMDGICKSFGSNEVLKSVGFQLGEGEICALLGENGAGKSTLMNILGGVLQPDSGDILLDGEKKTFDSPAQSLDAGIAFIHQELNLINDLPIYENMFIGRELKKKSGFLDHKRMIEQTSRVFDRMGLTLDPREMVRNLDASYKQIVEISRALLMDAKIIIMDEPTTSLTDPEIEKVFAILRQLRQQKVGIVFISHKLREVMEICDTYTVLRDGVMVASGSVKDVTTSDLARFMVGHDVRTEKLGSGAQRGEERLSLRGLTQEPHFRNIDLTAYAGEVLGVAGLVGSRRTELLSTIFGIMSRESGEITLKGKPISNKTPRQSIKNGFAMLTEERRATGIFPYASILFNTVISNLGSYKKGPLLSDKKMASDTDWSISSMHIKTPSQKTLIKNLSGGNQQKVILGRWLLTNPDVLLLDEPTRGIDVGAKYEIYELILQLAKQGKAVMMVSSEMPELIGICDRILVMSNGHMAGILERGKDFGGVENEQETIMRLAAQYV